MATNEEKIKALNVSLSATYTYIDLLRKQPKEGLAEGVFERYDRHITVLREMIEELQAEELAK